MAGSTPTLLDQELRITELSIAGGSGLFSATGRLALRGPDAGVDDRLARRGLPPVQQPVAAPGRWTAAGRWRPANARCWRAASSRASQAHFQLAQPQGPRLADDVVVVGRAPPPAPRRLPLPLDVDLDLRLRRAFPRRGARARRVPVRPAARANGRRRPLSADGVVNVDRGTYLAYGQTMFIDNGRLYFNGPPGDPGLEITACAATCRCRWASASPAPR